MTKKKQRNGCLTAWLIYLLLAYSASSLIYFSDSDNNNISENLRLTYGSIAILGLVFSTLLLYWIKIGFWGILTISMVLIILNILNGREIISTFLIFACVIILYFLLKIKKNGISGWTNLE